MYQLLIVMIVFQCVNSATVRQTPRIVSKLGGQVEMKCTVEGQSTGTMFWYRQNQGKELQLMFYSAAALSVTPEGEADGFTADRPSGSEFNLKALSLRADHSAVYYCAWRPLLTTAVNYFGPGTKLTVLEGAVKDPTITMFLPSPEEINEKRKATVVCLISNFYPDNIKITWIINNRPQLDNDVKILTDLNSKPVDGNKSYSISSRLRLQAIDLVEPQTIECKVNHYTSKKEQIHSANVTISIGACGVGKEEKLQSMGAAKLTYLILFCKSILYALFVSFLAWKTKVTSRKRFD